MKKKVLSIIALIAVLGIGLFVLTGCGKENNEENKRSDENQSENVLDVSSEKEIIGFQPSDNMGYFLDASGKLYLTGKPIGGIKLEKQYQELYEGVSEIRVCENGELFAKLKENNKWYLLGKRKGSEDVREAKIKGLYLSKVMIDENIKQIVPHTITAVGSNLFLTESGKVYTLNLSDYEKINTNVSEKDFGFKVKYMDGNSRNLVLIDEDNNGYALGMNLEEHGVLGDSDCGVLPSDTDKRYVSKPYKIGENIKSMKVSSHNLFYQIQIYAINDKDELLVMGTGSNINNHTTVLKDEEKQLKKIFDDVEDVYPTSKYALVKKKDGSLYSYTEIDTYQEYNKKVLDNVKTVYLPHIVGGSYILTNDNKLYGFGDNGGSKFGLGEEAKSKSYDEAVLLQEDVKRVCCTNIMYGDVAVIIKKDGEAYCAGYNNNNVLGLPEEQNPVNTWTKLNIN